jgi:L-ribulose-5-phosphate 3-epimerase
MQGRLCDQVNGKVQAFPWLYWEDEFQKAAKLGFGAMEWTIDQERLDENPLMSKAGRKRIKELCDKNNISIPSLTGDCFMQSPFWKARGENKENLKNDFLAICQACSTLSIKMVVVPLVDNGGLENSVQEDELVQYLTSRQPFFEEIGVRIVFESDYRPEEVARFIGRLPAETFGINYDIGNSAALGLEPNVEFAAYGSRVFNVHIKDRALGGTTVPLKTGVAKFEAVFAELAKVNYRGNFILQTARAENNDHSGVLSEYRDMTLTWIKQAGLNRLA